MTDSIKESLAKIAERIKSNLPAVTGDDNGKVLGVAGGLWAVVTPAAPPAGGFVCNCSLDDSGQQLVLDKTGQEIIGALEGGTVPSIIYMDVDGETVDIFSGVLVSISHETNTPYVFAFTCTALANYAGMLVFEAETLDEYPSVEA